MVPANPKLLESMRAIVLPTPTSPVMEGFIRHMAVRIAEVVAQGSAAEEVLRAEGLMKPKHWRLLLQRGKSALSLSRDPEGSAISLGELITKGKGAENLVGLAVTEDRVLRL